MRRGAKAVPWTTADVDWLVARAGRMPKRDICRHLRRSGKAVERMAARLRAEGVPVELRYREPGLALCPSCGCMRTPTESGVCRVCELRGRLAEVSERQAELWPLLSQGDRDLYERNDAKGGSRRDPTPRAPDTEGMSAYRSARAVEAWEAEVERIECGNLQRELKAAQKRLERMRRRLPEQ